MATKTQEAKTQAEEPVLSDDQKLAREREAERERLEAEQEVRGLTPTEVMASALGEASDRKQRVAEMPVLTHPTGETVTVITDPALRESDLARQDVGWHRPYSPPLPEIPDVSSWRSYQWGTDSARSNFDRVILWPGQVVQDTVQVFDAETCEEESVLFAGEEVKNPMVPVNYVDRRKRAMALQQPDPGVPGSERLATAGKK